LRSDYFEPVAGPGELFLLQGKCSILIKLDQIKFKQCLVTDLENQLLRMNFRFGQFRPPPKPWSNQEKHPFTFHTLPLSSNKVAPYPILNEEDSNVPPAPPIEVSDARLQFVPSQFTCIVTSQVKNISP
jgi:hypothetical protein